MTFKTALWILTVLFSTAGQLQTQDRHGIDFVQNEHHEIKIWGTDSLDRGLYIIPDKRSFLIVGMTLSNKKGQLMLTKLDNNLHLIWERIYPSDGYDFCFAGTRSYDGNFILTGFTTTNSAGSFDAWLIKIDNDGDRLWSKIVGGEKSDRALKIIPTRDGSYIVTGQTESWGAGNIDGLVMKINNEGEILWKKTFGDTLLDRIYSAVELDDGDVIISGITNDNYPGNSDILLLRISPAGELVWQKTIGGPKGEIAHSLHKLPDNTYFIVGYTAEISDTLSDPMILHLDENGTLRGKYILDTDEDVKLTNGYVTKDIEFIGTGFSRKSLDDHSDILLVTFDFKKEEFRLLKAKISDDDEEGYHAQPLDDQHALILGHTLHGTGDHLLIKWAYKN